MVSGFCVLPFICFSPWICVLHVWLIGWDYSLFLCPSAPPWLRHQSLLHPVVGTLSCWEYVSRRFEIVNLLYVLKPIGELNLGICFNLNIFDILALLLELGSLRHFSASLCSSVAVFASFSSSHSATLFSSGVSALPWRPNPAYSVASSLHCA